MGDNGSGAHGGVEVGGVVGLSQGPGALIVGQGRDGSGVSGLWMMAPFIVRGKTRDGLGREGELGPLLLH